MKKLDSVEIAHSFLERGIGLIGRKDFGKFQGLLLKKTNSIHTFGVFFPIDIVFLDKDFKILKIVENLKPLRFSPIVWQAKHVLELPKGGVKKHALKVDDQLDFS